jgi:anti-anti-sigma regulatory factor
MLATLLPLNSRSKLVVKMPDPCVAENEADLMSNATSNYRIEFSDAPAWESIATVTFSGGFTSREWGELRKDFEEHLAQGRRNWVFDLRFIGFCDSITLGCFIATQATARKSNGKIELLIKRDSRLHRLIAAAKLNLVLSIRFE